MRKDEMTVHHKPNSLFSTNHWSSREKGSRSWYHVNSSSGTTTINDELYCTGGHVNWTVSDDNDKPQALTTKKQKVIEAAKEVVAPNVYKKAGCVFVELAGITLMRDHKGLIHQSSTRKTLDVYKTFGSTTLLSRTRHKLSHDKGSYIDDWIQSHFSERKWKDLLQEMRAQWRNLVFRLMDNEIATPLLRWFGEDLTISLYNRALLMWDSLKEYVYRTPAVAAMALRVPWSKFNQKTVERLYDGEFHVIHKVLRRTRLGNKPEWTYLCKMPGHKGAWLSNKRLVSVSHHLTQIGRAQEPAPPIDIMKTLDTDHPAWFWRLVSRNKDEITEDGLEEVIDWLEAQDEELDKNQKSSWTWVKNRSDEWHEEIAAGALDMTKDEIDKLEKVRWPSLIDGYQKDGVRFVAIDNAAELKREGQFMGHCIGTRRYIGRSIRGKRRHFRVFVQEEGEWKHTSTCTISRSNNDPTTWKLKQLKGNGKGTQNTTPPDEVQEVAKGLVAAYSHVAKTRVQQGLEIHPELPESTKERRESKNEANTLVVGQGQINYDHPEDQAFLHIDGNGGEVQYIDHGGDVHAINE